MPSTLRHPLIVLPVMAALLAGAVLLALGFMGRLHPAFDAFAHFRLHLAIGLVVAALCALAVGQRAAGALGLVFAAASFATIWAAQWAPHTDAQADPAMPGYSLLQLNLRFDNPQHAAVLSLIARNRPDVVTLNEVSPPWAEALERIRDAYPYRIVCPFPNGRWGSAILSRRPFAAGTEPTCLDRGAMAVATVDLGGRRLDVVALHLGWPWPFEQAWQVRNLTPQLAELATPALLAGDLNSTPWSANVAHVMAAGDLHRVGPAGMTWLHRRLPRWLLPLGLAIDHVLAKGDVRVRSVEVLEDVGSDHLPVLARFDLPVPPLPDETEPNQVVMAGG